MRQNGVAATPKYIRRNVVYLFRLFSGETPVKRNHAFCLTALSTKTSPNRSIRFADFAGDTAAATG
ncbi:MAG: hypothetical protein DMF20_03335 [Verrucomicrobia bacterium]|nr:MAG: hypothetical protein DME48_04565 [Verrucomicrobiota bacterium]PYL67488.1 MAG: hypothetical protein DMF20_03335 [Verrucomicrobiota bacterium]